MAHFLNNNNLTNSTFPFLSPSCVVVGVHPSTPLFCPPQVTTKRRIKSANVFQIPGGASQYSIYKEKKISATMILLLYRNAWIGCFSLPRCPSICCALLFHPFIFCLYQHHTQSNKSLPFLFIFPPLYYIPQLYVCVWSSLFLP